MSREKIGNSLAEYGVMITTVIISLIVVYTHLGSALGNIYNGLTKSYTVTNTNIADNSDQNTDYGTFSDPEDDIENMIAYEAQDNSTTFSQTESQKAATQEISPEHPKMECKNGMCTIDFGDYKLKNIPENYQEVAESSGLSGDMGEIVAYSSALKQLAIDLYDNEDYQNSQLIAQLADSGHNLANIEERIEDNVEKLVNSKGYQYKFQGGNNNSSSNKSSYLLDLASNRIDGYLNRFTSRSTILVEGERRKQFEDLLSMVNDKYSNKSLESDQILNTVNKLAKEILYVADNMSTQISSIDSSTDINKALNDIINTCSSDITKYDSTQIDLSGQQVTSSTRPKVASPF